ncbi:hypothetical protein HK100_009126 [Physocladia obscura]|uniref:ATPase AAA-type core domain-containing protein n=1 Tax=Physocladia obscura TaxID=109957 RepID=A0AAD5XHS4_9FUNG|nr:hypothetical protein HK100_009126 [Physocladia obscura]
MMFTIGRTSIASRRILHYRLSFVAVTNINSCTPTSVTTRSFQSSVATGNELPLQSLRNLLVLSKDTERKEQQKTDDGRLSDSVIAIDSRWIDRTRSILCCVPKLEEYKSKLTERRHQRMLEFMTSERPYICGSLDNVVKNTEKYNNSSLVFNGEIYHSDISEDIRKNLLQGPVLRYGILTGPAGSGKSRLIRTLAEKESHYAVLSMGLISGVKSLVDALSEEIGYDFDDWTERMLQGYLFNGEAVKFPTQLDKLAFLLDEFEESCWTLKFDAKTGAKANRPILVLDDIDSLNLQDDETRQAVRLLFNAATKWAREDTALVVFTTSRAALDRNGEIARLIKPEVLKLAKVYEVGALSPTDADRFLRDKLNFSSAIDRSKIRSVAGTNLFDLIKICDEIVKTRASVDSILLKQLSESITDIQKSLNDTAQIVGESKMRSVVHWLDKIADIPATESSSLSTLSQDASYLEAVKFLTEKGLVGNNGLFVSEMVS